MLRREEELRLSEATQAMFRAYRDAGRGNEGVHVVPVSVQMQVADEFGVLPDICLEALRYTPLLLLPGDAEVPTLVLTPLQPAAAWTGV